MKIKVSDIRKGLTVNVSGDEPWLEETYRSFPSQQKPTPKITAAIKLKMSDCQSLIHVSGKIHFAPHLPCSRCDTAIMWPIDQVFDLTYHCAPQPPPRSNQKGETSKENIDTFQVVDHQIDCELIINEQIFLALPSQIIRKSSDGGTCLICNKDISKPLIYSTQKAPESPFAKLKGLKLKH